MTLAEFLETSKIKPAQFAQTLGVEPSTISRIVNGDRGPSLEMALRIEAATGGKVTPRDLSKDAAPEPVSERAA